MSKADDGCSDKPGLWGTFISMAVALVCPVAIARRSPAGVPCMPPPEGLAYVHSAPTSAEADLMRQVLLEAGFHPEYVPCGDGFGDDSRYVYVPEAEAREVRRFLVEYLRED